MNAAKPKKPPAIPMCACKSSQVESFGHHGDTLAVKFKSGGAVYHYHGVTAEQFAGLQKAESIGKALGAIKAKHKCTKLEHDHG
jgi:hypothetical protein